MFGFGGYSCDSCFTVYRGNLWAEMNWLRRTLWQIMANAMVYLCPVIWGFKTAAECEKCPWREKCDLVVE